MKLDKDPAAGIVDAEPSTADKLQLPIVLHDSFIEVDGKPLPGFVETEVGVRVEFPDSNPLYHVTVTFLTEIEPVIDPAAILVCAVEGAKTYGIRRCSLEEAANHRTKAEHRQHAEGIAQ